MPLKNCTGVFSLNSLQYREMTTWTEVYLSFGLRDKLYPWVQRMYPWIYHIPWTLGYGISLSPRDIPDQEVTCVAQHIWNTSDKICRLYTLYTSTSTYRLPYFIVKRVTLQPQNTKTLKKNIDQMNPNWRRDFVRAVEENIEPPQCLAPSLVSVFCNATGLDMWPYIYIFFSQPQIRLNIKRIWSTIHWKLILV